MIALRSLEVSAVAASLAVSRAGLVAAAALLGALGPRRPLGRAGFGVTGDSLVGGIVTTSAKSGVTST